jgi:GNAT superfamily N-acetyltransferase
MIKRLPLFPTLYELEDLFKLHFEEVYGDTNPFPPKVWYEQYEALEKAGMAFGLFALYEDVIVGYSVNFVMPNLHSKGFYSCINDVLFIDKAFRNTPLGLKLIKKTEQEAVNIRCSMMGWSSPEGSSLGPILERLGYPKRETVYFKEI